MSSRTQAFSECCSTCPRVASLEDRVEELEAENKKLKEKLCLEEERYRRLWRRYRRYRNPHTPSSKKLASSRPRHKKTGQSGGKQGRRKGHPGVTRTRRSPDSTVVVEEESCSRCGARLEDPESTETRVIEDIPEPGPVKVTEYRIGHYQCPGCGQEVVATHPGVPEEGNFGRNVLVQTTLLRFEERLPHRKISELFEWQYGLQVSASSIYRFTQRVADRLQPVYREIQRQVREADVVYADETGISLNGERGWVWTFETGNAVLYTVRHTRGKKVPATVLGKKFNGVIVCDGWRSYPAFSAMAPGSDLQRCWSHLLREADELADTEEGAPLAHSLHGMYRELVQFVDRHPPPRDRRQKRTEAETALRSITNQQYQDPRVAKLVNKIKNGSRHWFTFLTTPGVEPTNNRAERAIRKIVILRKIIGALRSKQGTKTLQTIMTIIQTWKQRGLDPYQQMTKTITS
jgi:transposase